MNKEGKKYFAFLYPDPERQVYSSFPGKRAGKEWREIELGPEVARGGEGIIYKRKDNPLHLVKIFHNPSPDKVAKLQEMLRNPPDDPVKENGGHISIAWPLSLVKDERDVIWGFIMPYIDDSFPLLKVYNPMDRRELNLDFTWEYFVVMALNLSNVVHELHKREYIIGDLNESNILVTRGAGVTLVDCDSIQVLKPGKNPSRNPDDYFLCTVGKPEYTPPELQGRDFNTVLRTRDHDNFSLAVLIFLMLMEGRHPFSFKWKKGGEPLSIAQSIQEGYFPYGRHSRKIDPPPYAIPFEILPPKIKASGSKKPGIRELMVEAFKKTPRPGADAWGEALAMAREHLTDCAEDDYHTYSDHLKESCPWCRRKKELRGVEPFPHAPGKPNPARLARLKKQQEQQEQQGRKRQNGYTGAMPAWQSTQVRQPGQEVTAPLPKGIAIASTSLKRRKKGGLNRITAAIGLVFLLIVALWIFNALPQQNAASLLANAINGNPLLVDSLHSDTGRRWPQNRACRFSKGAYSVQGLSDSLKTCVSSDPKLRLENAVIVVDVTLSSGSGEAGLVFGASGQRFYVFKINDQGTFSFLRHDPGRVGYTTLKIQTASNDGYFNSGGLNTLAVIANGSDFKFYVNGTYVGESRDTSYGGGEVGFAASGRGSFSNLKIYPAP